MSALEGLGTSARGPVVVSALFVHPVKSCRGVALDRVWMERRGPRDDRRWMVVDERGRFVSQREDPRLALVDVRIEGEGLRISAPGVGEIVVPRAAAGGPRARVSIWSDDVEAILHDEGGRFFSEVLGRSARLAYLPEGSPRPVSPARGGPEDLVAFADGTPVLAVSEASLAELEARLGAPVPVTRFRPNLVLRGLAAHEEDALARVEIGPVRFRFAKRCERCSVVTVDPATGLRGKEPLATLATYRREGGDVFFGVSWLCEGEGEIAVGDRVELAG